MQGLFDEAFLTHALCQLLCEHSLALLLAVFGKILEEIFEKSLTSPSIKV
jgi:hypothetical protein